MSRRILVILAAASWTVCLSGCSRTPPNLILITIDTLRADHLGVYGYARDTSPTLDALAREGTAFTRCYTPSSATRAAHASLFTASLPRTHGVHSNFEEYGDRTSLFTALRAARYATAGFVSSAVLNHRFGAQRQLDHFDDATTATEAHRPDMPERPARETLAAALAHIEKQDRERPFFVWIHLIDPHGPYAAPIDPDRFVGDAHAQPGQRSLRLGDTDIGFNDIPRYQSLNGVRDPDYYVARYDAEIRYADDALGVFFERLRAQGLYEKTLVVVTADHGETLAEPTHRRFFSHQYLTYEEVSRIPLILREPGGERRLAAVDSDTVLSSIDVAPTILDLVRVAIPDEFEGASLLRSTRSREQPVLSFGSAVPWEERTIGTQRAVLRGPWRYIVNTLDGSEELYDHRNDPHETRNRAAFASEQRAELQRVLADYLAKPAQRNRVSEIDGADRERLRALGYAP